MRIRDYWTGAILVFLFCTLIPAQSVPTTDTSVIDAEGTAHVTRVVPVPKTISPEGQRRLAHRMSDAPLNPTLAERRRGTDAWQAKAGVEFRAMYPVNVNETTVAGVPAKVITPMQIPENKRDRVLINVHGGGFNSDSGSLTETVPVANLTQTKVIAVLYRLAPEHPFPAAVDDTVAVYKELLKTYKPQKIGLYGTSAGAILTARSCGQAASAWASAACGAGHFLRIGRLQPDRRFASNLFPERVIRTPNASLKEPHDSPYVGATNPKDPVLSPLYANLSGFPPSLFITSTRDLLLSGTTILHRAFLHAGVDAQLVVFEALPHAFWNDAHLPESKEADEIMAGFFDRHLGSSRPHILTP